MRSRLKHWAKQFAYHSGALDLYHGCRHHDALTVVMFHRVLSPHDPRWQSANREYTLSVERFDQCLEFFQNHYQVVSTEALLEARSGAKRLPARPLLITFDDGWSDNEEYALPCLKRRGLPALVFMVSDAVKGQDERSLQMVTEEQLQRLQAGGVAIGSHGKTHVAFDYADDPRAEIVGSRAALAGLLGPAPQRRCAPGPGPRTLSFPRGRHRADLVALAMASGYELLFTSCPVLNPAAPGSLPGLLGRIMLTTEMIEDGQGRFRPENLAGHLFRAPIAPVPSTWAPRDLPAVLPDLVLRPQALAA
jgi:peptidoglycan/xylan/chitin deacetylase (PgdA/CDA1 family)